MRGWLRHTAGGLPAAFWLLWAGTLINRLGGFVLPFLAIYLTRQLHLTQSTTGVVLGLYGLGGAAGTMLGGILADRWGRRPTLVTAMYGAAVLMLGLGFARGLPQLATGALALGLFAEAARPAFAAMLVDVVAPADRLRAYSLNYWAINLGFTGSAVLAGVAAEAGYLLLFVVDAATTAAAATIGLLWLRETRPAGRLHADRPAGTTAPARPRADRPGLRTVARDRVFLAFVALNLPIMLVVMQHTSTLPIAMSGDGLGPATFGLVIALNGVMIICGQLFVPRFIDHRDPSRVLALSCVLTGVGFGVAGFAHGVWLYAASVAVWTLGEMLQSPSTATLMAELSPAELRGRYQGVNSLSWSAAAALAPILGGYVQQHVGNTPLWLGCAAVGVLCALGQLAAGPSRSRRTAHLRAATQPPKASIGSPR